MSLSEREHARLARELITACGGIDEAAANCRVSRSKLSDYQNVGVVLFMPADVMACLQTYCGKAIYSDALSQRIAEQNAACADLSELACVVTESSADLQKAVRTALADGRLSNNELDVIATAERHAEEALERLRGARRAIEAASPR